MPKGTARARLLSLLVVLLVVILGTSGRAQNPNSGFPHAAGGGYASETPFPAIPGFTGYIHFAFSAMNGPSGPLSAKGHGKFRFSNGDTDQGDVICFQPYPNNTARFTIAVAKPTGANNTDKFLLVEVMDLDLLPDRLGVRREQGSSPPDCRNDTPGYTGPVEFGNIVVNDGSQ